MIDMANLCLNVVEFENVTTEVAREKAIALVKILETMSYEASLLAGADSVMFESNWSCPTENLGICAKILKVDMSVTVSEWGCAIYGREYFDKEGTNISSLYLDEEEFDMVEEIEDEDGYMFEDEVWECKDDALDIILKRKEGLTNI